MTCNLEIENEELREERDNLNRAMVMIAAERDDYKNHFEACEAQRQRQLAELNEVTKERDELRAEVAEIIHDETGENSCEAVFLKSRFDELHGQIDDLLAEVERLKADKARLISAMEDIFVNHRDAVFVKAHSAHAINPMKGGA